MDILVLAHRGYRHDRFPEKYPQSGHENSMKAFKFALDKVRGFETDVILSRQQDIYLVHDTLLDGIVHYELKTHLDDTSQQLVGDRFIYQIDTEELSNVKLKDGQALPRLDDAFELVSHYPNSIINLELKGPNTNDVAIAAVEKAIEKKQIVAEQIIFSGFNLPGLRDLRNKVGTKYKIGALFALNTQTKTIMYPQWPDAPQDAFYTPFNLEENILENEDVKAINPDYFNLEYKTLTEEGIKAIDKFNPSAKIILWPAGEPHPDEDFYIMNVIEKFAASGKIYAVMSDFPEILQKAMEEKGLASPIAGNKLD